MKTQIIIHWITTLPVVLVMTISGELLGDSGATHDEGV
jgi:hypothetical protein